MDPHPAQVLRPHARVARGRSSHRRLGPAEVVVIERLAAERGVEAGARAEASAAGQAARRAMARQAELLDQLANSGVPFTLVAARLELLEGRPASPKVRARVARRLRKRRHRAHDPHGLAVPLAPPPSAPSAPISSSQTTNAAEGGEETDMAQLVKRTITEEYVSEEEIEGLDDLENDEDEDQDEEEPAPSRRAKR